MKRDFGRWSNIMKCRRIARFRRWKASGQRIDFAFIDGWHTFDYAMIDFFYVDLLLKPGGVLVIDDAWSYRAIRKLACYIVKDRRDEPIHTGIPPGPQRALLHGLLSPLRLPVARRQVERLVQPAVLTPDAALGLPIHDLIAFVKTADDVLGDGSNESLRRDQHVDF